MEKKTYYVSVQSGSVLPEQGDAAFEFEIEATDEEVSKLQELFDDKTSVDNSTFKRAHIPWKEYHNDESNDYYDTYLHEVYKMLHRLGTDETKRHIEKMGVLAEIANE